HVHDLELEFHSGNSSDFQPIICLLSSAHPLVKTSQENTEGDSSAALLATSTGFSALLLDSLLMATGTDTFPTRSSALWPALNDEELSVSSSSTSTTTSTITSTHQQRLLLPSTSNAQLNELAALLTSTVATSSAPQTFLDDLLHDDGDSQHQTQNFQLHEDVAVSSAMADVGVLSDAAFFSLGGVQATTTYSSSSSGSPSTPCAATHPSRLLQLETNYERKKKRAKINRKDLNSRFQELMDILHLKEDRKLNRAKILEKTIEHIEKLTAQVNALKAGQQSQPQGLQHNSARKTPIPLHHPQLHGMAMGQHNIASSVRGPGGPPLLPYNPSQSHPWNAGAIGTNLPLAPMLWMPCPVVTSTGMTRKRAAPDRTTDASNRKRGRVESVESEATTISEPVSSSLEAEVIEGTATSSSVSSESSVFEWSAQEIPTILSFCDAWTLVAVMRTSRELRRAAQSDKLWTELCRARWRFSPQIDIPQPLEQWQKFHVANRIPDCSNFTRGGQLFASGRTKGVSVWGMLSHRSNGHTTRTVLVNGKAAVMQVVELFVVVQNMSRSRVYVTDCISVSENGDTNQSFLPFTATSGAHLMPTVVAVNSEPYVTKDLAGVALQHGDLCVLSVFMACPGLELEEQFLQRAAWLDVQMKMDSSDKVLERVECVNVHAVCTFDRTLEKMLTDCQG
ncbi:hypothetical protein F441_13225, partial [Phytophthora nicotianae CJ01A1]